jgi:hypothetical protein
MRSADGSTPVFERDEPSTVRRFAVPDSGDEATVNSDQQARARENEETFASANEQILASAERYGFDRLVPFICECSEITCTDSIRLSVEDYRQARNGDAAFILLPGHEDPEIERIVGRRNGYVVVEKFT